MDGLGQSIFTNGLPKIEAPLAAILPFGFPGDLRPVFQAQNTWFRVGLAIYVLLLNLATVPNWRLGFRMKLRPAL